jgi:hypothetical protein
MAPKKKTAEAPAPTEDVSMGDAPIDEDSSSLLGLDGRIDPTEQRIRIVSFLRKMERDLAANYHAL